MDDVYLLSFVEDEPTQHVVRRIVDYLAGKVPRKVVLMDGYPFVVGGYGQLKVKAKKWAEAAEHGSWMLVVTDMDTDKGLTPNDLGEKWLGVDCLGMLPPKFIFRIAVREIESWIMADREAFAKYLHVSEDNVTTTPDELSDPKLELFRIIREKCKALRFKRMLPTKNQHVGIDYNVRMCEFVDKFWRIEKAMQVSPSLHRAVSRLLKTLSEVE